MAHKVLIVEDEYLIAMELRRILVEAGYVVVGPVPSVSAALSALARSRPDACVLDVNLQGQHASPVAKVLRTMQVPFVVSSAYSQRQIGEHAWIAGVPNIGKPASSEMLLHALSDLLV